MTTTRVNQKQLSLVQPREDHLYERFGFDREQIRYEFSNTTNVGLVDQYIEEEDVLYLDHDTVDLPDITGMGEGGGAGVSFLVEEGDRIPTTRLATGFTVQAEDLRAGGSGVSEQRNAMLELFDFYHDAAFLSGHFRGDGQWVPGIFEQIDAKIPTERIFDCQDFTDDTTDDPYPSELGTEENVIKYWAYRQISNELMSVKNPQWGAMVGNQNALSNFNKVSEDNSGRASYWERLNSNDSAGVGVRNLLWMPDTLTFSRAVTGQEPIQVSLVNGNSHWNGLNDDEVYLFPNMEEVQRKYWKLYETGTPEVFSVDQSVGRTRFDYLERFALSYDPTGEHENFTDCIKLTNVSSLFN